MMLIKKEWDSLEDFSPCPPLLTLDADVKFETLDGGGVDVCRICEQESDGVHFSTVSCRACAAFWRRSIVEVRSYVCKGNDDCDLRNVEQRKMCRSCRLRRCEEAGMQRNGVQLNRDRIGGKRDSADTSFSCMKSSETDSNSDDSDEFFELEPSSSGFSVDEEVDVKPLIGADSRPLDWQLSLVPPPFERNPLLSRMKSGFENYYVAQKHLYSFMYPDRKGKFFKTHLAETQRMERGCMELIDAMKTDFFPPYNTLPLDLKHGLLGPFEKLFRALDRNARSCRVFPNNPARLYMHYGQFVDLNDVFSFFTNENACELALPVCDASLRLRATLETLQIRDVEVAALAGISLWKHVAALDPDQADRFEAISQRIVQELHDDILENFGQKATPSRLTELLFVLHKLDLVIKELDLALTAIKTFSLFQLDDWEVPLS
ncbi:Nhr-33 [Aphelenchoides fujianensis]|nr:Nhr-33 [Aphelenchoides fujianensis]